MEHGPKKVAVKRGTAKLELKAEVLAVLTRWGAGVVCTVDCSLKYSCGGGDPCIVAFQPVIDEVIKVIDGLEFDINVNSKIG